MEPEFDMVYISMQCVSFQFSQIVVELYPSVSQTTVWCGASTRDSARRREQRLLSCLDGQVIRGLDAHCYQSWFQRSWVQAPAGPDVDD